MNTVDNNPPWGYHLIMDCYGCDLDAMTSKDVISEFTKSLVEKIDMVPYGEPQIVHFGTGNKEGFTLIQLIETSNISGHFANDDRKIFLDVFSCKEFDPNIVYEHVIEFFNPEEIIMNPIMRG